MRDITLTNGGKRRAILAVFVAVALLGAAFALFFAPAEYASAAASNFCVVNSADEDCYMTDQQKFNRLVLDDMLLAMGYDGYSAAEQAAIAATASDPNGGVASDSFWNVVNSDVSKKNTQNVTVILGGYQCHPVYLTRAQASGGNTQKGDVIVTMLFANDQINSTTLWDRSVSMNAEYPVGFYSTSYLRVIALNNGGKYAETNGNNVDLISHSQDPDHQLARFTMNDVPGSLTKFIATPAQVGYQAAEQASFTRALANEAYDPSKLSDPNWLYDFLSVDSSREVKYGDWKNDYIWEPSMTETGNSNNDGIWKLGNMSRHIVCDAEGNIFQSKFTNPWWLRGAEIDARYYNSCCNLYFWQGSSFSSASCFVSQKYFDTVNLKNVNETARYARPAFHFNLTAAYRNSEYPPMSYSFQLPDSASFSASTRRATVSVTASDIYVPSGKTLTLYVKSANGLADSKFCVDLNGKKAEYSVAVSGGDHVVVDGVYNSTYGLPVWQMVGAAHPRHFSEKITITLNIVSPPMVAGTWQDALTFTAVVT